MLPEAQSAAEDARLALLETARGREELVRLASLSSAGLAGCLHKDGPFAGLLSIAGGIEGGVSGMHQRDRLQSASRGAASLGRQSSPSRYPGDRHKTLAIGDTVFVLPGHCVFDGHWRDSDPLDERPSDRSSRRATDNSCDATLQSGEDLRAAGSHASIALHSWDRTWVTRGGDGPFDGVTNAVRELADALEATLGLESLHEGSMVGGVGRDVEAIFGVTRRQLHRMVARLDGGTHDVDILEVHVTLRSIFEGNSTVTGTARRVLRAALAEVRSRSQLLSRGTEIAPVVTQ